MMRVMAIGAVALGLLTVSGCGSSEPAATGSTRDARASRGLLLAQFATGVGAVSPSSKTPVWNDPAAVSAIDGSAVFSVRHLGSDRLVRVDRHTGVPVSSWRLAKGLSISAVSPGGSWIALTKRSGDATTLVVFDSEVGSEVHRMVLSGDVRPEAFSVDGDVVFALDYRGDHYRVQTIDLATGRRSDIIGRDKRVDAEDMRGASVSGVMNADRTLLATLYRNPGNVEEPAFVHVLDLEYGWSYCADLPPPFGTGSPGSDVIELTPRNTVVVASTRASRIAEIHIAEVHKPGDKPVSIEYRDGSITAAGAAFGSTPGFAHVITAIPA
jgi:hypothetical protein